jgi:L-histidine N-alpha-methyltransferase
MHALTVLPPLSEAAQTAVGSEVFRGLSSRPKTLSPWLFYDREGSRLFEEITELPEYYATRAEREIFADRADEIIAAAGSGNLTVYELGAGTASKTGLLLRAALRRQPTIAYHAIDISESALVEAKTRLQREIQGVTVEPLLADYTEGLGDVSAVGRRLEQRLPHERRMFLYIGSSIGNFETTHALRILRDVRRQLVAGDTLLLGTDLVKERQIMLDAYDDAAGVTAAFNKNVLTRINRELGSNFNLHLFRHRSRWNSDLSRIEMHLESLITQIIFIPALDLQVRLARAETIHTENSYKFTDERVGSLLHRAGFEIARQWKDGRGWFGEYLALAV